MMRDEAIAEVYRTVAQLEAGGDPASFACRALWALLKAADAKEFISPERAQHLSDHVWRLAAPAVDCCRRRMTSEGVTFAIDAASALSLTFSGPTPPEQIAYREDCLAYVRILAAEMAIVVARQEIEARGSPIRRRLAVDAANRAAPPTMMN